MFCAAIPHTWKMIDLLLTEGADPFLRDVTGANALDIATRLNRPSAIALLEKFILAKLKRKIQLMNRPIYPDTFFKFEEVLNEFVVVDNYLVNDTVIVLK